MRIDEDLDMVSESEDEQMQIVEKIKNKKVGNKTKAIKKKI
jgi:hypothetical protein